MIRKTPPMWLMILFIVAAILQFPSGIYLTISYFQNGQVLNGILQGGIEILWIVLLIEMSRKLYTYFKEKRK